MHRTNLCVGARPIESLPSAAIEGVAPLRSACCPAGVMVAGTALPFTDCTVAGVDRYGEAMTCGEFLRPRPRRC